MFLNYIRKKLYANLTLARQSWETKNNNFYNYQFKHLNLEYRKYRNSNPTKYFYIIRRAPGAGFFSNLNFVIHHLLICDNLKMIPVIDMENFQTFYNCKDKILGTFNSWNYYFKSVSKYTLEEVYKSKNVIICDNRTSQKGFSNLNFSSEFKYFNGFEFLDHRHKKILKKYIKINDDIIAEAENIYKKFKKEKILGICFRGSDQKKSAYHPYTPTEKQMIYATNLLIKKYNFKKIYLCTEDNDYLNFYKKKYNNVLFNSHSIRTTDKKDLFDSKEKYHRYKIGRGNLVDMLVLSKTNFLLFASSNIPSAAIFFSNYKIPRAVIDNGMKGNIFVSQFSWYLRKNLPPFLGGFRNKIKEIK
tara:strand:- start:654 stop:1730 length:1077 start_codon:yes stop_codon:yes gene_type:complete